MLNQPADPAGQAVALSQAEQLVLYGISVGATPTEISARWAGSDFQATPAAIETTIAALRQRGLLQAAEERAGPALTLTGSGRRIVLGLIGQAVAVTSLQEEREQVERLRTDLLATISHELRTPLTLIRTSIGLLLDSEPDAEMRLRLLRNIKQSSDRMNALVTDLLDLARLRQDRLELSVRNIDLLDLVRGTIALLQPLLDARAQRVTVISPSPAPVVPGDLRRLERVLLNLIGNANTFAPAGTAITVTIRPGEQEATIGVQDEGPGIASDAIPHLFDQFFTDRTSSSGHSIGAGLGLPIAQGIVRAHGGHIWVESAVGAGTTVWFTLPTVLAREVLDESPRY